MLTLYHADTAVCAAKVRVTLTEKLLPWQGVLLNLGQGDQFKPDYLRLNRNGVVPTLVHDGAIVTESTIINEFIDDAFLDIPLRPADALGRAGVRLWTKREDSIHDAINTMTVVLMFRPELMAKSAEDRARRYESIPDPTRRDKWRDLLDRGLESKHVREALIRFARLFRDMDQALARTPWLTGDLFTLADVGFISFFYRLDLMQMAGLWKENFPHVTAWYTNCCARPSFRIAIGNYISPERESHFLTTCAPNRDVVRVRFATVLSEGID